MKSKGTAAVLAFFLGAFGGHKFYLGQKLQGWVRLLFFWTFIPALIAYVDFIILLTMKDEEFERRYVKNKK